MNYETINGLKYLTLKGMQAGAVEAVECTKIIRQWLPIKGGKALGSVLTMDQWFERMANHCIEFFRFHPVDGRFATIGPDPSALLWRELCVAMVELRKHYDLELVDGEKRLPHSNVRGGKKLKPIDAALLDRIEQAAKGLLAVEEGEQIDERKEAIFQARLETTKSWPKLSGEFGGDPSRKDGDALRKELERYAKATNRKLPNRQR